MSLFMLIKKDITNGFQGVYNPLKSNVECCGYVCKYISLDGGPSFHHNVLDP